MTTTQGVLERLNDEQREAVLHDDHTVVVAGPGSGNTSTLVAKVNYLLNGPA